MDRSDTGNSFEMSLPEATWKAFIEGPVYAYAQTPWRDDPAFGVLSEHPGLRDSIGGDVASALTLAIELVQAIARIDLHDLVRTRRPARGLSLGFGMNVLEPYDLLQVFELDRVYAYEWIGEQVIEAARTLQALRAAEPALPTHPPAPGDSKRPERHC